MNIFSNKFINLISIIITIIVFILINFFINNSQNKKSQTIISQEIISDEKESEKNETNSISTEIVEEEAKEESNWRIEIESINLIAPIEETTEMQILNSYVGHFEKTALTVGNVGLAGHNRGYEKNYFAKLKDVKMGDEIQYTYNDFSKTYIVDKIEIIRNTDWSYLENTEENRITMITCTENEPDYRLCVQGVEKE